MTKIQATRKQLYVVESTPAISIDDDGYVRCGLSEKMEDNGDEEREDVQSQDNSDNDNSRKSYKTTSKAYSKTKVKIVFRDKLDISIHGLWLYY